MTRIKEVEIGSEDIPNYKSSSSRIVHSLRKAYNNLRSKHKEAKDTIKYYQIKTRDLEKSRSSWKQEAKEKAKELEILKNSYQSMQKENKKLKGENEKK